MIELRDENDQQNFVQEGESANLTAALLFKGVQFNKLDILTLTLTLYDKVSNQIINEWDEKDVLDANGCSVATDGTVTLELNEDDNIVINSEGTLEVGSGEQHVARLSWTWNDGNGERRGKEELTFRVEKLATPVAP